MTIQNSNICKRFSSFYWVWWLKDKFFLPSQRIESQQKSFGVSSIRLNITGSSPCILWLACSSLFFVYFSVSLFFFIKNYSLQWTKKNEMKQSSIEMNQSWCLSLLFCLSNGYSLFLVAIDVQKHNSAFIIANNPGFFCCIISIRLVVFVFFCTKSISIHSNHVDVYTYLYVYVHMILSFVDTFIDRERERERKSETY